MWFISIFALDFSRYQRWNRSQSEYCGRERPGIIFMRIFLTPAAGALPVRQNLSLLCTRRFRTHLIARRIPSVVDRFNCWRFPIRIVPKEKKMLTHQYTSNWSQAVLSMSTLLLPLPSNEFYSCLDRWLFFFSFERPRACCDRSRGESNYPTRRLFGASVRWQRRRSQ